MRYFLFLSAFAVLMYAATAEDIYQIYKTKGIGAVEEFLKKEFERKFKKLLTRNNKDDIINFRGERNVQKRI